MKLIDICLRELKSTLSDHRRLLFLLGALWAYLFLFGALYAPGIVRDIPVVFYDADQTALSQELIELIDSSDTFKWQTNAVSEEEMLTILEEKGAYAAIEIPADFSKNIRTGRNSNVMFMVNGSNIIFTSMSSMAIQDIINNFSDKVAVRQLALKTGVDTKRLSEKLTPVNFNWRLINNPTQTYLLFFCIGLALTAFQTGLLMTAGATVHQDLGEFRLLKGTPWLRLFIGKFIVLWIIAQLSFIVFLFLAQDVWGIPMRCSFSEIYFLCAAASAAFLAGGMGLAPYFKNELNFLRGCLLYVVPSFILSGYTWPLFAMPEGIQWLAKICFPITWVITPARNLMLSGTTSNYSSNIFILLLMTAIFSILAIHGYKRRYALWQKAISSIP